MSEEITTETMNGDAKADWNEAIAASADAALDEIHREEVTDMIDVPADPVKISAELVEVDDRIKVCRTAYEAAKARAKACKADLESATGELNDLIDALRTKTQTIQGTFVVEDDLRLHVERWYWKDTMKLARERPIPASKRQLTLLNPDDKEDGQLALGGSNGASHEEESDDDLDEDDEDESCAADDDGECDDFNSQPNLNGDPDDTEIDAASLLAAAQNGSAPKMSKPPSKPSRRGRKAK